MSRQEAINTFNEGLLKDINPINTPNTTLTDCVNGTIITYDGNEYSLQNDKGNYELNNCELPDGYIPVGTTEYGGIIYIVSYNPMDKKVEIGSYPSTRVVPDPIKSDPTSGSGNGSTSGNYSILSANCKLNIFSGADPEKYKLYPGDEYRLSEKASSSISRDEFFVVDENKTLHDITNEIKTSKNDFIKVSWGVPGWIAVKTHIANIDSFSIRIKSISVPTYFQKNSKIKVSFRFRIIASDPLITEAPNGLGVTYTIGSTSTLINQFREYSLGNGSTAYYFDTANLEFKADENTIITVKAVPNFHGITYDTSETTFTYKVSNARSLDDFNIGRDTWKYKTLEDKVLINFSTEGLEGYKDISDLSLKYSIYSLDKTLVTSGSVSNWEYNDYYTTLEIPFIESFVKENIYVIKFEIFSNESVNSLQSITKLLIATELLNKKYGENSNFDNLEFSDWIEEYKNHINTPKITIEESEPGHVDLINTENTENTENIENTENTENTEGFKPQMQQNGLYTTWASKQESKNFDTLLPTKVYNKISKADMIDIEAYYKCTKKFKIGVDCKLLSGPLWEGANTQCRTKILYNNDGNLDLNVAPDGTIETKDTTINGKCSIKYIYKPDIATDSNITVWSWEEKKLSKVYDDITCNVTDVNKQNDTYEVRITTKSGSSKTYKSNDGNHILPISVSIIDTIASKLKTNDVIFLRSFISCMKRTNGIYGVWLKYTNVPLTKGVGTDPGEGENGPFNTKVNHYIALPTSSYKEIQIIPIGNENTTDYNAQEAFNRVITQFSKIVCEDDAVTGGFITLKQSSKEVNSNITIKGYGFIELPSMVYLGYNLFKEADRKKFIDYIVGNFPSLDINYNLLTSSKTNLLPSFNLDTVEKSFDISNIGEELKAKLTSSLEEENNRILERNKRIFNQLEASNDKVFINYTPDSTFYIIKEEIPEYKESGINSFILDSLNRKEIQDNTLASFTTTYYHNGEFNNKKRSYAFAYRDPNLSINTPETSNENTSS